MSASTFGARWCGASAVEEAVAMGARETTPDAACEGRGVRDFTDEGSLIPAGDVAAGVLARVGMFVPGANSVTSCEGLNTLMMTTEKVG